MKLKIAALMVLGFSGLAQADILPSLAHGVLCDKVAATGSPYQSVFQDQWQCLEKTQVAMYVDSYSIQFASCATGDMVTAILDAGTTEVTTQTTILPAEVCQ